MTRSLPLCILFSLALTATSAQAQVPENVITTDVGNPVSVCTTDVDGDGDTDVLSADETDNKIAWYESDGSSDPSFTTHTITTNAFGAQSVHAADIDGDGDADVLSASADDNKIVWYENDGSSNPTFSSHAITTNAYDAQEVYATDIDGDGDTDVLSAVEDKVERYENDGASDPNFTIRTVTSFDGTATDVFAADVDGDGDTDVISSTLESPFDSIYWHENDGASNPTFTDQVVAQGSFNPLDIHAADIDGDGDTDIPSASVSGGVEWYENDGTSVPSFTGRTISSEGSELESIFAMDVDGDEDTDILTGSVGIGADGIVWYENDGAPDPSFAPQLINNNFADDIFAADVDGDEDTDVLSASPPTSSQPSRIAWYENTSGTLPVDITTVSARVGGGDVVQITWQTASEEKNAGFEVQRKAPGKNAAWTTIDFVEGAGTSSQPQTYRSTDEDLPYDADRLSYRLRQVDTDGTTTLSSPMVVERGVSEVELLAPFPNPASQQATVRYALPTQQDVEIQLYDALGRQVRTVVSARKEGRHEETIDMSRLSSGTYFLRLQAESATKSQQMTVVR